MKRMQPVRAFRGVHSSVAEKKSLHDESPLSPSSPGFERRPVQNCVNLTDRTLPGVVSRPVAPASGAGKISSQDAVQSTEGPSHTRPRPRHRSERLSEVTAYSGGREGATAAAAGSDVALERHRTIGEIAKLWHLDYKTVRREFEGEPGVLTFGPGERRFKRSHVSMRIPESIMIRVHRRLRKPN